MIALPSQDLLSQKTYARCIRATRRVRWNTDTHITQQRTLKQHEFLLPTGMSLVDDCEYLTDTEQTLVTRIQARSYANFMELIERSMAFKNHQLSQAHLMGDSSALEAFMSLSADKMKHESMFRELGCMVDEQLPDGYHFLVDSHDVIEALNSSDNCAALAFILHQEYSVQAHYKQSLKRTPYLSPIFKDAFYYHWKEEAEHVRVHELEFSIARQGECVPEHAFNDFLELLQILDDAVQAQAHTDVDYFLESSKVTLSGKQASRLRETWIEAYRSQHLQSSFTNSHFSDVVDRVLSRKQLKRVQVFLGL